MQKQKQPVRMRPRFVRAAVLAAGLMLGSCAAPQQTNLILPQQSLQEKPGRVDDCITVREAMQKRVSACRSSQRFSACVFGKRMLFSTKYESTEELEMETGLKQDILSDLGISLMSNGRSRELVIREILPDGVRFGVGYGMQERATVPGREKRLISIGGKRKLEQLDRVKGGEVFFRFDGSNEDEVNSLISGMDLEIMSVQQTANGVRIRLVADIYENCLEE